MDEPRASSEAAAPPSGEDVSPADGPTAGSSLPARVVRLFVSPAALFDELRVRPRWIGALLLVVAIALLVAALIPSDVVMEYVRQQMTRGRPDVPADAVERGLGVARFTRFVGPVVGTAVGAFLISAVLFLIYELGMGGEAGFKPVLASTSHTLLIPTIGNLLTLPIILRTGDLQASLSLDLLMPGMSHAGYAFRLLHGLNLFGLWGAVVLGIAMSRLYPKRSAGGAITLTVALYLVVKALLAVAGGVG